MDDDKNAIISIIFHSENIQVFPYFYPTLYYLISPQLSEKYEINLPQKNFPLKFYVVTCV